jgi:hypothetical protein
MNTPKLLSLSFVLAAAFALDLRAAAAQYCAEYDTGTRDCAIPSLQMCQLSVRGVGGICVPDTRSQPRVRRRGFPLLSPYPYPDPTMPPPPFN